MHSITTRAAFVWFAVCTLGWRSALAVRCPTVEEQEIHLGLGDSAKDIADKPAITLDDLVTTESLGYNDPYAHTCQDGSEARSTGYFFHCCKGTVDETTGDCHGKCVEFNKNKIKIRRRRESLENIGRFTRIILDVCNMIYFVVKCIQDFAGYSV